MSFLLGTPMAIYILGRNFILFYFFAGILLLFFSLYVFGGNWFHPNPCLFFLGTPIIVSHMAVWHFIFGFQLDKMEGRRYQWIDLHGSPTKKISFFVFSYTHLKNWGTIFRCWKPQTKTMPTWKPGPVRSSSPDPIGPDHCLIDQKLNSTRKVMETIRLVWLSRRPSWVACLG